MTLSLIFDSSQSIFGWRTASPSLAINHPNLSNKIKQHTILKNYRTPKQLVELANEFRRLFVENGIEYTPSDPHLGSLPDVLDIQEFGDPNQEIEHILREIKYLHDKEGVPYSKVSILCRRNEDLNAFESGVVSLGIPYYFKYDSQSLMNQSPFKFLYALYTLLLAPTNILAYLEVISPIKGVGDKFKEKLKELYSVDKGSIVSFFSDKNRDNIPGSKGKQWDTLFKFTDKFLSTIANSGVKVSLPVLNRTILQYLTLLVNYEKEFDFTKVDFGMQRNQLMEVFNTLSSLYAISAEEPGFKSLPPEEQFNTIYENLQLSQDVHNVIKNDKKAGVSVEDRDALGFYTVHSYKGKENDYIYYAATNGTWALDYYDFESRCVFYVAITRSKRKLTITGSQMVKSYDGRLVYSQKNPFVAKFRKIVENYSGEQ